MKLDHVILMMLLFSGCAIMTVPQGHFLASDSCNGTYVESNCQVLCANQVSCINDCNVSAYYDSKFVKDNPNAEVLWVEPE